MNYERFLDKKHKLHYIDTDKISNVVVDVDNCIVTIDNEVVPCRDFFHIEDIIELLSGSYGFNIQYK